MKYQESKHSHIFFLIKKKAQPSNFRFLYVTKLKWASLLFCKTHFIQTDTKLNSSKSSWFVCPQSPLVWLKYIHNSHM